MAGKFPLANRHKPNPKNMPGVNIKLYDDRMKEVSWDDFFARFEGDQLALVYQTETEGGKLSRFARIVRREAVPQAVIE